MAHAHGTLVAHDVGALVGVSGTTIGQWARRGYIRSSQRETEPRLYSVEDVAEAAIVKALLDAGVRRVDIRRAVVGLRAGGHPWPLSEATLATSRSPAATSRSPAATSRSPAATAAPANGSRRRRIRLLLRDDAADCWLEITPRGWQAVADPGKLREVRLRLRTG